MHEAGATSMRGARPSFTEFHKWMALELIAEKKRVSRQELSRWLSLGEGSVRTLLGRLKREKLVASCRSGHELTEKGRRYLGEPLRYVQVDAGEITVGEVDVATLVRGAAGRVRPLQQRDEAIKAGASGATILIFRRGRLEFPEGFVGVPREVEERLIRLLQPREGDAVVIGTGDSLAAARAGASAAARILVKRQSAGPAPKADS
jgi:DNA-binding PadR family transcriptional regulator